MKGFFKSKKGKVITIVLAIVIVVVILIGKACASLSDAVGMMSNIKDTQEVEVRDLSDAISASGEVQGISKNNVTSAAAAEVTAVNVSVGDTVTAGDVLCTMDTKAIEESISELQAVINNSDALESKARAKEDANLTKAQENYNKKSNELSAAKAKLAEATEELDKKEAEANVSAAESALEMAQESLDAAKEVIENRQYEVKDTSKQDSLKQLQEQLADCVVKAPISGLVTAVNVSVGDTNTPKAVIFTIEDTSKLKIKVSISESDILKVEEGMKATITASALGDEKLNGEVTRVVRVKDQSTGMYSEGSASGYAAEITVSSDTLLVGMTAKVKIIISERASALCVPYDMVREDENGNNYIFVAEPAEEEGMMKAVRKDITVGQEVNYYTEVIGGDLSEGDVIVYDFAVEEGDTFYTADNFYIE